MVVRLRIPLLALGMAVYLSFFLVSPSMAGMVGSVRSPLPETDQVRGDEIRKIQRALESELVKEKLKAYGLAPEEIKDKLQDMTDEQIHLLAKASDKILAGGDAIGVVIGILVIILLVILILKLLDKSIVIK